MTLSGLLRGSPQIADAVRDGLPDPFDVPDCLLGPFKNADARDLHDRSGGFVRRLNAATADPISAPDLFLLLHCADLRERGLALAAAAKPLFDLIGSPAIELEQRAAMQRAGVGALTWGDTRLAGAAEAEQIWLAEIARQLEPSCSAHASATALASSIALTLGAIDAQLARIARVLDQVETKGLLHSVLTRTGALLDESATPLLTPAMKATLNRALGPGGTFANLVHNAGFAPTAGQALSLLGQARDALKPAKDWTDSLDKLAKATPGVLRYLRQPTAWHEQEIQLIEQLVSVMSVVILYGSQETRLLVSELATSVSTLRIPRRGGATLETVKWVETRIVGYHGAKGSGGAVPDGQSSFDTRAASRRTTVETQTLHVRGGGLSEDLPLGPNSPWASRIGHLGDGFAAMFSLANLAYRFSDDDAKDWAENWIAITYDAAALANLGMKHGGRALNLARVVTIAEARVNPIVSLIDAALCTYRLAIDWGEKPWWSSAGDFVALLAAIAGGAVVVMGIVSTAPLWLIVGSALLSLAAIFFPDYVPDDIKAGLALLKGQVERSSFGRLQLPSRIGPQPRPLTTLMAGDHGGSVGVLPARTQTEEEKEWADRLRDLPDSSSLQQATALTLATAAMSAKILPAQLAIQSATTPLGVPDLWLPAGKQVRGVWIKIATPALIAASARITIFPHGSERSARVQISAQVDGATLRLRADLEGAAATGRLSMYTVVGPRETNPDENAPLGALLVIDDKDRGEISASVDVPLVGATASMVQLFAVARGIGEPPPELSLPAGETLESSLRRVEESRRAASFLVKQLSPRLVRLAQE